MKKPFVAALVLLAVVLLPAINAQQHAPTTEVCRADEAVWGNRHAEIAWLNADTDENGDSNRTAIDQLSLKEVLSRIQEMGDCQSVDPGHENSYYETMMFYSGVRASRALHFIYRHNLMSQLISLP
jgi:hypothetical protein